MVPAMFVGSNSVDDMSDRGTGESIIVAVVLGIIRSLSGKREWVERT